MVQKKKNNIKSLKNKKVSSNTVTLKKIRTLATVIALLFFLLIIRLAFLQFVQGAELKESAFRQQTVSRLISPKRGNILDCNGKALAISAQVDTVSINPTRIKDKTEALTKAKKEKIAKAFSEIFELDYEETLAKVNSTSSVQTIAKKVEKDKIDELKKWMSENNISTGINIDEDTKRYYPYSNLAAYVIGFCNSENQGIYGIERSYNSYLTGTPGKIVTTTDVNRDEISNSDGQHIDAENGNNIVLTIDASIQSIAEKYLKEAVEENNARNGSVIIMKPSTGDILAMAQYPDYDLNTPFTPTTTYWQNRWDSLTSEEKTEMYRNINLSSRYEPGSTFKLVNASVALEENITEPDIANDFSCIGYETIADVKISCWTSGAHGMQSLRQVLQNSCNPGMMQLARRIGTGTLYRYYKAFGLFNKTSVGLPDEISSDFHKEENVGPTELATLAFGQRIKVTPLQLITAISAIANDGVLMQPRIVKEIVNTETNVTTTTDVTEIRQVISKETSEKMLDIMESVVTDGTGKTGAVKGYSVGGKTGTSEPPVEDKYREKEDKFGYVASFVAVSPAENPEIVILVALYNPQVKNYHGGTIAGPVASKIMGEVLPYLGISPNTVDVGTNSSNTIKSVPNIVNKTVAEAQKVLENNGFRTEFTLSGNKNETLVTAQVPSAGTKLPGNSLIMLYTSENDVRTSTTVPDLTGMSAARAANSLSYKKLNISVEGSGKVVEQHPEKGSLVEAGTVVKVILKED